MKWQPHGGTEWVCERGGQLEIAGNGRDGVGMRLEVDVRRRVNSQIRTLFSEIALVSFLLSFFNLASELAGK